MDFPARHMCYRLALSVVIVAVAAGCSPCMTGQCRTSMSLGSSADGQVPGALEATADQFLGEPHLRPDPVPAASSARTGTIRLSRDTLSPDSDTPHHKSLGRQLSLRNEVSTELAPGLRGVASLTAGLAQSRYHLPDGLGVLADPTTIGFSSVSVDPALGLVWTPGLDLPSGGQLHLGIAAGREVARIRTTVRSALLDVTNYSTQSQGYVEFGLGLELPPPHQGDVGTELALTGRRYGDDVIVFGGALRLRR